MQLRNKFIIKYLYCTICGFLREIPRKKNKNKKSGHIKHMWCFDCKKKTAFEES